MNIVRFIHPGSLLRPVRVITAQNNGLQICSAWRNPFLFKLHRKNKHQALFVSTYEVKSPTKEDGVLNRLLNKIPFINVHKMKMNAAGYILYEEIADKLDYDSFFVAYDLPDTFYSWFVVTELHIWMLSVRVMADGEDGVTLRNGIIEAFWRDVEKRAKKLGAGNPSAVRQDIQELSEQFQAALIAYDEGLQLDDTVMAGALWRRLYKTGPVHPHNLEKLVEYIRKQIALLDIVPSEQLIEDKKIKWESVSKQ